MKKKLQILPKERHQLSFLVIEENADRSLREIQHRFILFHRFIRKQSCLHVLNIFEQDLPEEKSMEYFLTFAR